LSALVSTGAGVSFAESRHPAVVNKTPLHVAKLSHNQRPALKKRAGLSVPTESRELESEAPHSPRRTTPRGRLKLDVAIFLPSYVGQDA
jgi:hypothetical protein